LLALIQRGCEIPFHAQADISHERSATKRLTS
jgi:hypothetical protein